MTKASLLLALAFICAPLLRRRSPVERHVLWAAALLLAAVLPLLSGVLPAWQPGFARQALALVPHFSAEESNSGRSDGDVVVHADAIETSSAVIRAARIVWLTGIGVVFLVWIRGAVRLRASRLLATTIEEPRWRLALAEMSKALDVRRPIALLQTPHGVVPTTWGWRTPRIVVPVAAAEWPVERIRVVLAHEIGHVRRHDWIVHVMARIACTVYWFNPLFWMASRRLHQESEQACDALVLQLGVDGRDYATHLLAIARALVPHSPLMPALGFVRRSTLERRFEALLGPAPPPAATRRAILAAVLAVIVAAVPIAAVTLPEVGVSVHLRTAGLPSLPDFVDIRNHERTQAMRDVRLIAARQSRDLVGPSVFEYSAPPLYSDEARARRIEGTVTLEARIDTSGRADVLRVVRGLGFGLDENARLALRQWEFVPATRNGVPVDSLAEVDIAFSLANEAINELIANDMATRVGPGVTPPRLVRRVTVAQGSGAVGSAPGSVVLDVLLREDGSPKVVRIVRSLDSVRDREAISAFEQWRFSPAIKDGQPVKVRLNAEVTFHS